MSFSPEHGKTPAGGIGIPKDMQQGTVFSPNYVTYGTQ